jgi:hypothetical protein
VRALLTLSCVVLVAAAGCGGSGNGADDRAVPGPPIVTRPVGVGPGFRIAPRGALATAGRRIGALTCRAGSLRGAITAHLEIFARRETLVIPKGIGVVAGRCRYPVRTLIQTGLIVSDRAGLTLGDLFAVWGQRLGPRRIAGFAGPVAAFVGGRRVRGDIRRIVLRHHSQIVVEVSGYVPPHAHYVFPRDS